MHINQEFKCALCGTLHQDVISRAECEIACAKKKEEAEMRAAELKKAAEYETRKNEVDEAFNAAYALKDKFVQDYGRYTYNKHTNNSFDGVCLFDWFKL